MMTDTEITALMKRSPDEGRRELFEEYCQYVYAIVTANIKNCGTREDAEECVGDVFADVYRFLETHRIETSLKALIGTIAKRRSIDFFRRHAKKFDREVSLDSDDFRELPSAERVDAAVEKKERNRLIMEKIAELGEPDSTIIVQQFFYNRTSREIADIVSLTAANVQKRSSRARKKLRTLLSDIGISY